MRRGILVLRALDILRSSFVPLGSEVIRVEIVHLERALTRCSSLEERQIPLFGLLVGAIRSVDRCDQVLVLVDASLARNLMVVVRHEGACTCNSRLV